jgi:hypothetical protein
MKTWRARHEFSEGKRKKDIGNASEVRLLHAPHKEKEKAKMNWMTQRNNIFNHQSQPLTTLKGNEMAHASTMFCIFFKFSKRLLYLNNPNITTKKWNYEFSPQVKFLKIWIQG